MTGNLLANDTDPDADPLTASLEVNATHGIVALDRDGGFIYTPSRTSGTDGFTYTVSDGIAVAPPPRSLSRWPRSPIRFLDPVPRAGPPHRSPTPAGPRSGPRPVPEPDPAPVPDPRRPRSVPDPARSQTPHQSPTPPAPDPVPDPAPEPGPRGPRPPPAPIRSPTPRQSQTRTSPRPPPAPIRFRRLTPTPPARTCCRTRRSPTARLVVRLRSRLSSH